MSLYRRRTPRNAVAMALCCGRRPSFGLASLALILGALICEGLRAA